MMGQGVFTVGILRSWFLRLSLCDVMSLQWSLGVGGESSGGGDQFRKRPVPVFSAVDV
jgi:hypothetical protein